MDYLTVIWKNAGSLCWAENVCATLLRAKKFYVVKTVPRVYCVTVRTAMSI